MREEYARRLPVVVNPSMFQVPLQTNKCRQQKGKMEERQLLQYVQAKYNPPSEITSQAEDAPKYVHNIWEGMDFEHPRMDMSKFYSC